MGVYETRISFASVEGEKVGETEFPSIFKTMEFARMFVPDLILTFISGVASLIIVSFAGLKSENNGGKKMMRIILVGLLSIVFTNSIPVIAQDKEEYISKVIIEGKWGTGAGEFGYTMCEGSADWPRSFVVDNEDNVFILDQYNNRIQKFNKNGEYENSIPIQSYKLASRKEVEKSKKSWNYLGNDFPSIRIEGIELIDGNLYAFQNKRIGGSKNFEEKILKYKNNKFGELNSNNEIKKINERRPSYKNRKNIMRNQLKDKRKFGVEIVNYGNTKIEELKYDNRIVKNIYSDIKLNYYILSNDGKIRKYNQKEEILFEMNLDNGCFISPKGNIYTLELFTDKKKEPIQGFNSYTIDDYNGIRIIKWSQK
ncbi:MAG: hypothetical protein AB1349_11990 [Elusimicrobiota bacterium]